MSGPMASPIGNPPPFGKPPPGSPPPETPIVGPSRPADRAAERGTPVLLPEGWVGKVADKIISTVDSVRAKTTVPIEKIGRVIIWGLLIATAGVGFLIVLLIGVLRVAYELVGNIPGIDGRPGRSVWIIDVLLGVALIVLGLFFINKGTIPEHED